MTQRQVSIERLGRRGEGVAETDGRRVHVPYALPGERVAIDGEGDRRDLVAILERSPDRIPPICPHFTICGGCAVQALAPRPYAEWKRSLLLDALSRSGVLAEVAPLVDAHGTGRRRATFHARIEGGEARVGFMRARAHDIVAIDACPILDPGLAGALPAARAIAAALLGAGKPLDVVALATQSGLDIDLRGLGSLPDAQRRRLLDVAMAQDLARLSNHGVVVVETRRPSLTIGSASLAPPPGAFVQATAAGEAALARIAADALRGAGRIADLFAGIGTFALRLATAADVSAFDTEEPALAALDRAARAAPDLRPVRVARRDLFHRPLAVDELARFDAVILDPPRAGAEAQVQAIAASAIERVVSISCDAQTFARDAAILIGAGFVPSVVTPIDQFRYTPHLEIVAVFRRPPQKRRRTLLG